LAGGVALACWHWAGGSAMRVRTSPNRNTSRLPSAPVRLAMHGLRPTVAASFTAPPGMAATTNSISQAATTRARANSA